MCFVVAWGCPNERNDSTRAKQANKARTESQDAYMHTEAGDRQPEDFMQLLIDAREYDVPYYVRCSIDLDIRSVSFVLVTYSSVVMQQYGTVQRVVL